MSDEGDIGSILSPLSLSDMVPDMAPLLPWPAHLDDPDDPDPAYMHEGSLGKIRP